MSSTSPVGNEREFLAECGLVLREAFTIGGDESVKRYVTKADGTQVGAATIAAAMARLEQYTGRARRRLGGYQIAEAVVA